jgi:ATP synthase protein I
MRRGQDELKDQLDRQTRRMKKAEHEHPTLMSQTVFVGTLGLVFVLPVVGGAYLGRWLDGLLAGYSVRWSVSLILLGVFVGMFNVYLLIKE